jgi:hypothetical protein
MPSKRYVLTSQLFVSARIFGIVACVFLISNKSWADVRAEALYSPCYIFVDGIRILRGIYHSDGYPQKMASRPREVLQSMEFRETNGFKVSTSGPHARKLYGKLKIESEYLHIEVDSLRLVAGFSDIEVEPVFKLLPHSTEPIWKIDPTEVGRLLSLPNRVWFYEERAAGIEDFDSHLSMQSKEEKLNPAMVNVALLPNRPGWPIGHKLSVRWELFTRSSAYKPAIFGAPILVIVSVFCIWFWRAQKARWVIELADLAREKEESVQESVMEQGNRLLPPGL